MTDPAGARDERLQPLIDAALHRYFSQLTRRYTPVLVGFVVLALVVFGLPSQPERTNAGAGTGAGGPVAAGDATGATAAGGTGGQGGVAGAPGAAGSAGATDGAGATNAGASGIGGPAGATPGSASGVARSGVTCGAGVLQVTWTSYAPPCVAAFTGDNGGATAPGVTGDEITVVMRTTEDWEAFQSGQGEPSFEERVADTQLFVDLFNANFELYGRRVVLRAYVGDGQVASEVNGGGQAGAQTDAQTAQDMGAFAALGGFLPFATALGDHGIIHIGSPYSPSTIYEQYSPYLYASPRWMMGLDWGQATAAAVCDRMNGLPAIFAGDPIYQNTNRVFGMTTIDEPSFAEGGNVFEQTALERCGARLARRSSYTFDIATQAQQAVLIVSQMKAAGVTTLVHAGDPLMYAQMTLAAAAQGWHPEYIGVDPLASIARLGAQREMANAFVVTPFSSSPGHSADSEAGRVFRLASGGQDPQSAGVNFPDDFMNVLLLFNALQGAGPNLTADSFLAGLRSLPEVTGEYGLWRPSQGYSVPGDFVVARWYPDAKNTGDGAAGDFLACDAGTRYPLNPQSMGSGQLAC